nr:hypothetical protein [Humibacter ginsenosidimutans]
MVLYRAERALLRGVPLRVTGLHDRAFVFIDGRAAGVIDGPEGVLDLGDTTGEARLDLLVENCGRASGGPLLGQHKGILGDVMLGDDVIEGWSAVPIALDRWDDAKLLALAAGAPEGTAGVAVTRLEVGHPADASLMLPGFGSGFVWINGFLLGRYRSREPELPLYVPAPLLRPGVNAVTILELEHCGTAIEWRSAGNLSVQ